MFRLAAVWVFTLSISLAVAGTVLFIVPHGHMTPDGAIGWPPIQCGKPCVIEEDHGGIVDLYTAQANWMASMGTPVIIDGPCISACTIFADIDRANVCVTTNAVFGYHKTQRAGPDGPIFGPIDYTTPGLNAFIAKHGGLPDPDSGHLLMVGFEDLRHFYRPCLGAA